MGIKKYKPTSPGRRGMTANERSEVTAEAPYKKLVEKHKVTAGRNNYGRITSRFRGGGHKRRYRVIDFRRDNYGVPGKVAAIEYDPNRTCFIALVNFVDGDKRYILAPEGLSVGDTVVSSAKADINPGNSLPLAVITVGTLIHNHEIKIGRGGTYTPDRVKRGAKVLEKEGLIAIENSNTYSADVALVPFSDVKATQ